MIEPERQVVPDGEADDVRLVAHDADAGDAQPAAAAGEPPAHPPPDAHAVTESLKYTSFDDRPGSTHNLVVSLVPPGSRVLEVGCATGYMSEVLRDRLGCTVVGVELSPGAAALAEGRTERVVVGDAETIDWEAALGNERFDAIVLADVLEHLRDPGGVLERVGRFLADGGAIVSSVPNVAHVSVRLALLGGEFRYRETGLLDDTHARFFTRVSLQELFERSGYTVALWARNRRSLEESEVEAPHGALVEAARALVAADPESTTYQFVVRAVPAGHATLLAAARTAADERAAALDSALAELGELRERVIVADAEVRERDWEIDRLDAEIGALETLRDDLLGQMAALRAAVDSTLAGRTLRLKREVDARLPRLVDRYRSARRRR